MKRDSGMADSHQPLLTISNLAKALAIHPQTLRLYERHGFITPVRTKGNTRLYSEQDIAQIRVILHLTRHLGVNLAGVEIVLHMQQKLAKIQQEIDELRQFLAIATPPHSDESSPPRALVKASSRKLVKVL
jgi:MerR family transcriptional regulator, heat shock protein HspR